MKHRNQTIISLISAVAVLSLACQCVVPSMLVEPTPTSRPTPEGDPLPPQVVYISPARGEEQQLDAPVQVIFDQAMDTRSVERAFAIEPDVDGEFEWISERAVLFMPDEGYDRAEQYTLTLNDRARSARGEQLKQEFLYKFATVGFLEVTGVYPEDGTTEVDTDATITVLFNRPVVPLVAIEDQGSLPQPLTFVPPVRGEGEWLNTSIYTFTPEEGFEPATEYKARIAAGLEDTTGGVLEEDFTWEFTTLLPGVVATYPAANTTYVSPEPTIYVAFNQPMDRASVEAAFTLENQSTGETVAGTFEWHDAGLALPRKQAYEPYRWSWDSGVGPERVGVETVGFTPDEPLDFDTRYTAAIAGADGARGGTSESRAFTFTTIEYPAIVSTNPRDGEQNADPGQSLEVVFSSPMDPDSFDGNFTISPPVSATRVYTYWRNSSIQLNLSFPVQPNTDYAVTIDGDVRGRYGHELGEDTTIRWHTRSLYPLAYLHTTGRTGTYNAYTQTLAYVSVRNVRQVEFALYEMPADDFVSAQTSWSYWEDYYGRSENLIREWTLDVEPVLDKRALYGTRLTEAQDGLLEPGIYYLQVSVPSGAVYPEAQSYPRPELGKHILVVSRYNLTIKRGIDGVLVWATDLDSGEVLPGLPIGVESESGRSAEGTTDADGVFYDADFATAERWTSVFAFAGDRENPDADFGVAIDGWSGGISPWDFDLSTAYDADHSAYFFTDRPIYRPGQTVYFKGILRGDDDAHYSLPSEGDEVEVVIYDAQGTGVYEESLPVSDMGTLHGELGLAEEASLGSYYVQAIYQGNYFGTSFRVAEYRKPEFQVTVETDAVEYAHGDEIEVTAEATYFFGGAVADAEVRYAVLSSDHYFNYTGGGWWDFTDSDYRSWWYWYNRSSSGERIAEGEGTTDENGMFSFTVEADIAAKIASQRFTLEVTVVDINDQEVSNRAEAIVHKGTYYIGLKPDRYVGRAGEDTRVNIITVDWASEPAPNKDLTVVFSKHDWYSVRKQGEDGRYYWESVIEDTPVYTATVETDAKGEGSAGFAPEGGGIYKVTAIGAPGGRGGEVRSSTYMWVSGREYVNWRMDNNDRIDLVTDKRQYQVGDTATIMVPHPYQGEVQALITVERGRVYDYWVETLETNSDQIEIPITEDLIPNVYVSVVVVKGVDENNPYSSFKAGYARLSIETTEKELNVTMTPDKSADEHYRPGDTATYDVYVTDSGGDPVEAELALSLVDLSVLTLADRPGPGIVDHFWRERGIGVRTASGLTLSGDRITEEVGEEAKGLGGGGGGEEFGPVRQDFRDSAYWNPIVRTGEDGHATVSADLPDNLTTWRMSAWGVTAETRVGESDVDIVSTKSLLIRPVTPRFFVVGDEAEIGMVVHNNTEDDLEVEVAFEADGLQVASGKSAGEQVEIPAGGKVRLAWPVVVGDVEEVTLSFGARGGYYADAVEITLPVYRYSAPEVVATAGHLAEDGQVIEAAALPPVYDPAQGELSIHLDPSLAAGMTDGLDYLEHYPYECTEQTVSRFLPNVVTYRAFKELGLDRPDLEASLPGLVSYGLQRLYNRQHYDGGWGWWVNDDSNPYLTAYVLLGMIEAERAGFVVDEEVMSRAAMLLKTSLSSDRDVEHHYQANRRAFILYVLAEIGSEDTARMVTLFGQREMLDTFGKAYLAMGFGLLGEDYEEYVDTLLSDITAEAIVSATGAHWEESRMDYYAMNTDTRSTAIVLAALSRLDPDHPLAPNVVRWLMVARKDGYWETTQETAWALIALTDWMVATGELEGAYNWHVVVNGDELGEGRVSRENIRETVKLQIEVADLLEDEANRVVIERWAPKGEDEGSGRLYYSMYLRYYKPVEEVTALNRGIIVSRRYTLADCDPEEEQCRALDQARVGDVIEVKLTLIAPNDLHYVVVEDPLPAGTEGVDQSLETTSVVGERPSLTRTDRTNPWGGGYGWWWFSHSEMRDEKAVLFATYLPRGTYEYTYYIRASLPGEYRVIPTHAYEMYFPEVFGRSDGGVFTIVAEED